MQLLEQHVELLPGLTESMVIGNYGEILNVPYSTAEYTTDKVKNVIWTCVKKGHLSVLEHVNITLKIRTNIGTYKDYTRHRHCAFTIESTSFVKYDTDAEIIMSHPPSTDEVYAIEQMLKAYKKNASPKFGRDLLPQCLAATVIMTTNIREWRWIIALRGDPNDNPLTIELRDKIWQELNRHYPFFFPLDGASDDPMVIHNAWGNHDKAQCGGI